MHVEVESSDEVGMSVGTESPTFGVERFANQPPITGIL